MRLVFSQCHEILRWPNRSARIGWPAATPGNAMPPLAQSAYVIALPRGSTGGTAISGTMSCMEGRPWQSAHRPFGQPSVLATATWQPCNQTHCVRALPVARARGFELLSHAKACCCGCKPCSPRPGWRWAKGAESRIEAAAPTEIDLLFVGRSNQLRLPSRHRYGFETAHLL
jgi:hypothetical protein